MKRKISVRWILIFASLANLFQPVICAASGNNLPSPQFPVFKGTIVKTTVPLPGKVSANSGAKNKTESANCEEDLGWLIYWLEKFQGGKEIGLLMKAFPTLAFVIADPIESRIEFIEQVIPFVQDVWNAEALKLGLIERPASISSKDLARDLRLIQEHSDAIWIPYRSVQHLMDPELLYSGDPRVYYCESCKTPGVYVVPDSKPFPSDYRLKEMLPSTRRFLRQLPVRITLDSSCLCRKCSKGRSPKLIFTTACGECNETFTWEAKDGSEAFRLNWLGISFPLPRLNESNLGEFEDNWLKQDHHCEVPSVGYLPDVATLGCEEEAIKISEYLVSKFFCKTCQTKLQLKSK